MDRITGVTKRDIRDALVNGIEVEVGFLETKTQIYHFSGRLTDGEFLSRLYDTSSMPGSGGRCKTLDQEIWQHTVNNDDWSSDWVFCGFCLFVLILSCMSYLYILEINPLSIASFLNISSHSTHCLFILFMASFAAQKVLSLIRFYLVSPHQ